MLEFASGDANMVIINTHQGSPQYVIIDFEKKAVIDQLKIMFQGGFAGKVNKNTMFIIKNSI